MVGAHRRLDKAALLLALALGACARQGPPAPVVMGGGAAGSEAAYPYPAPPRHDTPSPAVRAAPVAQPAIVHESERRSAPPAPQEKPRAVPQEHAPHPDAVVVGKGETLYMIARRYDLPVRALIDANHLEPPYRLAAGTRLRLPQARFHTVQAGETLYSVSRLYGVEVSALASLNHLSEPYAIRSGEVLALPASTAPAEKGAPPPTPQPEPAPPSNNAPAIATPQMPAPAVATAPPPELKPRAGSKLFAWPVEGRIVEAYGTGPAGTHNDGINIAVRAGEPVRAADAGRVAYAGNELRGYGNLVLIKHAGGYMTAYAHNSKLLVRRGELVKRGQEIALAGATGSVSSPQLHFEIRRGTRALDPTEYLPDLRASVN